MSKREPKAHNVAVPAEAREVANDPPETVRRYALRIRESLAASVIEAANAFTHGPRAAGDSWGDLARSMVAYQAFTNQQHDATLILYMWRTVPVARWIEHLCDTYGGPYRSLTIL